MISKPTEDTITAILKEELEKIGVNVELLPVINTPSGIRKPDLLCRDGGIYPIEAKFKERDLIFAISKIQNDYLKHHKVLGINGGFAILYPEEISRLISFFDLRGLMLKSNFKLIAMFPDGDPRPFKVYEGLLSEIAEILAEHIFTPPKVLEPSIDYIIKSIRDSTINLLQGLVHLSGNELEGFFGGNNVFKNILQYEEDKYPVDELRHAAAYILVNQLLFYQVLSRIRSEFPEIDTDTINTPSNLNQYFERVLNVNYKPIFSYDVASLIPRKFLEETKIIINVIGGLGPHKVGGDLLGTIFHDLIPYDIRKKVAAFYTNIFAAEFLASLSIDNKDAKVADFAVGSGGLLVAAYRRKKNLFKENFTQKVHRNFVEKELIGIDVMPFASNIAACHLSLQSPQYFTNKICMAVWDSTDLMPGITIPSIADLEMRLTGQTRINTFGTPKVDAKGVVGLKGKSDDIKLEKCDIVIMNPPFTRQERMPKEYKTLLSKRFHEYKDNLHGQLSYYGYFVLLADRFLKRGGRLAFVLPAAFLRTKSAEGIRRLISDRYKIEFIITGMGKLNFSEATWRREILFVAKKLEEGETNGKTLFVALNNLPDNMPDITRLTNKIKLINGDYEDDEIKTLLVSHRELEEDLDWFRFIASFGKADISTLFNSISSKVDGLIRFGELYDLDSVLKRGIESSRGMKVQAVFIPRSEKRAIRKEDLWILKEIHESHILVHYRGLPESTVIIPIDSVVSTLRTIAGNNFMDISDKTDFVVIKNFPEAKSFFFGERESLINILPKWKVYVEDRLSNLIILRRFPINAPGTIHLSYFSPKLTAGPGMTWVARIPDEEAKILSLWFNSSLHLVQVFLKRVEDIWIDVHKYILENMLVLNPNNLSIEKKKSLLKLFDKISKESFPTLEDQYINDPLLKKMIDLGILEALGFNENESELFLTDLYKNIKIQFNALRELSK